MSSGRGLTRRFGPAWPWISLTPLGLGAWAPVYAGLNAGRRAWVAWGALWTMTTIAGWVLAITTNGGGAGGGLIILGWAGSVATSFAIRSSAGARSESPLRSAEVRARGVLRDADHAREIVRTDPRLARQMGIGRPDVPGAADAGLVDVNHASATALRSLPGVDDALAARIVETRAEVDGFSSLEDFGTVMDLGGDQVERLRERAIFLPWA